MYRCYSKHWCFLYLFEFVRTFNLYRNSKNVNLMDKLWPAKCEFNGYDLQNGEHFHFQLHCISLAFICFQASLRSSKTPDLSLHIWTRCSSRMGLWLKKLRGDKLLKGNVNLTQRCYMASSDPPHKPLPPHSGRHIWQMFMGKSLWAGGGVGWGVEHSGVELSGEKDWWGVRVYTCWATRWTPPRPDVWAYLLKIPPDL